MEAATGDRLRACGVCGLILRVGLVPRGKVARCPRCRSAVRHSAPPRSTSRAAAFALAALVLYPLAMALPVLEIEEFGHRSSATIWSGVVTLFSDGEILLALIVFLCSIVIPLGKIGGVFVLCAGRRGLARRHRAATYRALDWLGRWGMVDVLLVAVLVALVKLGDIADVHPGPGAAAFAGVVVFSMLASTAFDHLAIWEESSA